MYLMSEDALSFMILACLTRKSRVNDTCTKVIEPTIIALSLYSSRVSRIVVYEVLRCLDVVSTPKLFI